MASALALACCWAKWCALAASYAAAANPPTRGRSRRNRCGRCCAGSAGEAAVHRGEHRARHGVLLVEDETYGYLVPDPPPPLASLAPERTYFLASTAKSLAPGLRIGYLLAPAPEGSADLTMERLAANVAATSWMAAPLMAELADAFDAA